MKIIGFNGSPRKDGNTTTLLGYLLREISRSEKAGFGGGGLFLG